MKKSLAKALTVFFAAVFLLPVSGHAQWITGSGVLYTNAATSRVGIGTTTPQDRLHIESSGTTWPFASMRISNVRAGGCKATGVIAIAHAFGSFSNIATAGDFIMRAHDNGSDPEIGTCAEDIILTAQTANGAIRFATSGASGTAEAERVTIDANGRVGIGTNAPCHLVHLRNDIPGIFFEDNGTSGTTNMGFLLRGGPNQNVSLWWNSTACAGGAERFRFDSNGNAYKSSGGGDWLALSDARTKTDVQPFTDGLDALRAIRPVQYQYKQDIIPDDNAIHIGVIAQEIQKIAPYTVQETQIQLPGSTDDNPKTMDVLAYDGTAVRYIIINAVQELDTKVSALQAENVELKKRVAALEARVGGSTPTLDINKEILLEQNSPNPFSESTNIMYFVPGNIAGKVEVVVADASGNTVLQRIPAQVNSPQQVSISAKGMDTGVYLYGISVNGHIVVSKKMMIMR